MIPATIAVPSPQLWSPNQLFGDHNCALTNFLLLLLRQV